MKQSASYFLLPHKPHLEPVVSAASPSVDVDDETLRKILLQTPKGLAPGPSGLRIEHIRAVMEDRKQGVEEGLLEAFTLLANSAISGRLPLSLQPYLCGGRLIPVRKKDGGIRPIVVGEVLRSLIAKAALAEMGDGLDGLQPLQVGVGGQGPWSQAAIMAVRNWVQDIRNGSTRVLAKVDLSNAFNSVHRTSCIDGIRQHAPGLLTWTRWSLSQTTTVFWDGIHIPCATGVQQGDPCAPALFSVAIHDILEELSRKFPSLQQVWYLDDGVLFATPDVVESALSFLEQRLRSKGLTLNQGM